MEIWTFYNKTKFRVRYFYKKLLVMTTCCKQVKIINLCVPNNNLHKIPIPSFFQAQQKGRVIAGLQKVYSHFSVKPYGLV